MKNTMSIEDIIAAAIESEIEAYEFYRDAAAKTSNPAVKEAFSKLSAEELGHRKFLETCMEDTLLLSKVHAPEDYMVAETVEEPALTTDMKPVDAIALAMKKEQAAAELYSRLAKSTEDNTYRKTFEGLANMELAHKARLETLFVDIGYPEVF